MQQQIRLSFKKIQIHEFINGIFMRSHAHRCSLFLRAYATVYHRYRSKINLLLPSSFIQVLQPSIVHYPFSTRFVSILDRLTSHRTIPLCFSLTRLPRTCLCYFWVRNERWICMTNLPDNLPIFDPLHYVVGHVQPERASTL